MALPARTRRVLVVEDDPSVRALLEAVLQDLDTFEIVLAERGDEGLRLARLLQPDVLVLDVMLPGLGGPEVISELRAADGTLPFAILVLTGAVEAAEALRAELGRDAVIEKPFDIATLTSRVKSLVAEAPATASATLPAGGPAPDGLTLPANQPPTPLR